MPYSSDLATIHQRPIELLQNLIRFNTTNPPGNEAECIGYIDHVLTAAGFETTLLARDPARPNLVTRLAGQGEASPLLLYGHVDVVPTENQIWEHPPFEGKLVNSYVWGRGALDDKGGVTMLLAALLRAKAEGLIPSGDVVLAIVSDEELGGKYGAGYLVENQPTLFEGIRYAIGEGGGFAFYIGKQKFYPIMVAEKQGCVVRATVRGPGGHASLPLRGGATARLAQLLQRLDKRRLPVHITPVVRQMLEISLLALPLLTRFVLSQLLNPSLADRVLNLLGTKNALKQMMAPGLLAIASPIAVGLLLGKYALGAMLLGGLATSALLSPFFTFGGGIWDNAKKSIEGKFWMKGTPTHAASVIGDTVGDPLKDVAGPSLNIFMKLTNMTALLIAPILLL